jgi:formylmethanofuran dehydrogenase subunit E
MRTFLLKGMLQALVVLRLASAVPAGEAGEVGTSGGYYPRWLAESEHAPRFQVRDTVNKYGRYDRETKTLTLEDLIKFHGHFCGGLVESAGALRVLFDRLFPDGVVDRTDLRVASNNSACGGDVVSYLSGARARFGAHLIDPGLKESEFVVQRVSTGQALKVRVHPEVYPTAVRQQMRKIESGQFAPEDIDRFQSLQWEYARRLTSRPLVDSFIVEDAGGYVWPPPPCRDLGRRHDNDYKDVPEAP